MSLYRLIDELTTSGEFVGSDRLADASNARTVATATAPRPPSRCGP